jgi:hypothetical protein
VRRNLSRGGDRPSSEADLARGGDWPSSEPGYSLARCCAPRAKRSFARGWLGQLSWWRDYVVRVLGLRIRLCFVFYERKWVLPGFFTPTTVPTAVPRALCCGGVRDRCRRRRARGRRASSAAAATSGWGCLFGQPNRPHPT